MSDGAHIGVGAERALGTVLGGEDQPTDDEKMSVEQMREWLLSAPRWDDPAAMAGYDECARSVAGECLRWALANPERYAHTPMEDDYNWEADPDHGANGQKPEYLKAKGLYDVLKAEGVDLGKLGITGFQWGWAYNAARRCLELPPKRNPAILELEIG